MLEWTPRSDAPEWRNWQTRRTQNPVGFTPREGSTPSSGTKIFEENFVLPALSLPKGASPDSVGASRRAPPFNRAQLDLGGWVYFLMRSKRAWLCFLTSSAVSRNDASVYRLIASKSADAVSTVSGVIASL